MDVIVPHTRSMADLLEVLDVIVADDPERRGDFWRVQPWVPLPASSDVRPGSYPSLHVPRSGAGDVLADRRIGVPRMYINADPAAGTAADPGIGGPTGRRIVTRGSILECWEAARADLERAGATVVEVDFPAVSNYEGDRPGAPKISTRGLVPPEALRSELLDLSAWAWDDFLRANGDPSLPGLAAVDGRRIWPKAPGELPDRYDGFDGDVGAYPDHVRTHPVSSMTRIPHIEALVRGLDETGRLDVDTWMDDEGLDAVVFPAVADIGAADMDVNPASADLGWRNGVWVANGNLAIRHLGVPTATVPMGLMRDTRMPVGLTFAGRRGDDVAVLRIAGAFDAIRPRSVTGSLRSPLV